jgi:hypothetical protein
MWRYHFSSQWQWCLPDRHRRRCVLVCGASRVHETAVLHIAMTHLHDVADFSAARLTYKRLVHSRFLYSFFHRSNLVASTQNSTSVLNCHGSLQRPRAHCRSLGLEHICSGLCQAQRAKCQEPLGAQPSHSGRARQTSRIEDRLSKKAWSPVVRSAFSRNTSSE